MRLLFTLILLASPVLWATTPPLELAKQLTDKHQVERYLASEKYDGIRATWINGELRSRGGLLINTPANLPQTGHRCALMVSSGRDEGASIMSVTPY